MKTHIPKLLLLVIVSAAMLLTTSACVVHTQPVDNVYVASGAPAHIHYSGRDLYYRTDGYYYYDRGSWWIAPSVPTYVARYHRPTYRSSYYRPTHRTSYRPSYSRPAYQGSYTRPNTT